MDAIPHRCRHLWESGDQPLYAGDNLFVQVISGMLPFVEGQVFDLSELHRADRGDELPRDAESIEQTTFLSPFRSIS